MYLFWGNGREGKVGIKCKIYNLINFWWGEAAALVTLFFSEAISSKFLIYFYFELFGAFE